ncbi:MAG: putative transposase [Solirubrobacteraceae bacterium]
MGRATVEGQLEGMPEPFSYWRAHQEGQLVVGYGPRVLFRFDEQDVGMRNLAVVALTEAGARGKEVAALFGLSAVHVSRLRRRAADGGSRGLVPPRGAPRKLSVAAAGRAVALSEAGHSGAEIARRLGVSEATISRLLARRRPAAVQGELGLDEQGEGSEPGRDEPVASGEERAGGEGEALAEEQPTGALAAGRAESAPPVEPVDGAPIARLGAVEVRSRYAGAMLLHPFLERLGAEDVLGSLPAGPARRYDAPALVLASAFGFALGSGSLEQTKHLALADAGALAGLAVFPGLRTLRPRLAALAESSDPLAIQRSFSMAMLAADEHPPELFYVDDHFVTYWGGKPLAKGYNIRRHLAEPGRDDTFVVDDRWRAVCFASGKPRGLSVSLPDVLCQLKEIVGGRPVMIGFDRGGSYPKTFNKITDAGMEWVTWRRAPLVPTSVPPRRSWVQVNGKRRSYLLADEQIELDGYEHGPVRQLSAYEHGTLVFQVLTANRQLTGAPLVHRLKSRWCIENTNKYLEEHQQIHWLCSYQMNLEPNTANIDNPGQPPQKTPSPRYAAAASPSNQSPTKTRTLH